MALKDIITKVISKYGVQATLRTYTTTENEYGEVIDDTYTEKFIYVVLFNNIRDSYLRQILGYSGNDSQSYLVKADEVVDENSKLIVDGKEYQINDVEKIIFKGETVAKVLHCS